MKKVLLLFFIGLFISCNTKDLKSTLKGENIKDSIRHYFHISNQKNLSLIQRSQAVNKSLLFAKVRTKDSTYTNILYQKNLLHFNLKEYDSLKYYNNLLINNVEDQLVLAKQYYLMAYYFEKIGQVPDSAFFYYNFSKDYFQRIGDSSWIGKNLLNMGNIQKNQNDFFGSKETLTEALQYLHPGKDKKFIASSYSALGTNHRKLMNYEESIKYFKNAISKAQSIKDGLAYKNNLSATYIDNKKYDDAIQILEEVLKDSALKKGSSLDARIVDNLAYAKWLSGEKIALIEFLMPLKIRRQNKDNRGQIASYTHLGEFYSKTNTQIATSYFDSVIRLSKTLKIPRAEKDALKFLMKLKPKNVNLRNRYVFLQDSLYAQELKVKTQFANYKYNDKLKQESILRLEKENAEKELEASQQRNQKIMYLGGLLFITSFFGLSLYSFRQRTKRLKQKSKAEKLEAIHETESELSRKLHDDHGGKLNQAMLLVQRDADKSVILDTLELVYNRIRNFSREINTVDTGPDFWKGLKATLEYTKPTEVEMTFDGGKELNWSLVGHQTKTILFKVLQELIINMARHSKANQTVILFKDQNKELFIYYEDDGVGASEESLLRKNGLRNTEKRIQAINGSITFDSEEGNGFRAEIRIPK